MRPLAVLTRDLRTHDNPLLELDGVVPLFVSDPRVEALHHSPNRQAYLAETLHDLDARFAAVGGGLIHRRGAWLDEVLAVADEIGALEIHLARDVSGFAARRVASLRKRFRGDLVLHDHLTVVAPDACAPAGGTHYQVFTPYHRRWLGSQRRRIVDPVSRLIPAGIPSDPFPAPQTSGVSPLRERGGEAVARDRLAGWLDQATAYDATRDRLAVDGTSHLSAALHFGTLSALEVADEAEQRGADAFVRQLAWRDFNHQLLFHRPTLAHDDLRPATIPWLEDERALVAWQDGTTGYPVVDAAMRQLRRTGWMHNRARMIAASFLTRDLRIDWRVGAAWFMRWLTDGDVANNQLGWQWVAGTGTDTNPFRILNPTLQGERFDPEGAYIRRWVDELADVGTDEIHDPGPLTRAATDYPVSIVDHLEAVRESRMLASGAAKSRRERRKDPPS